MALTEQQVRLFNTLGYVNLPGVVPVNVIDEARSAYNRMRQKCETGQYSFMRVDSGLSDREIWGIEHIFRPEIFESAILKALMVSRLLEASQQLLNDEDCYIALNRLHCTKYFGHVGNWHRDGAVDELRHVQICLPLYPEAGFYVVPGSHSSQNGKPDLLPKTNSRQTLPGEVIIPVVPGDLLLFHSSLIHRGSCAGRIRYQRAHAHLRIEKVATAHLSTRSDLEQWNHPKILEAADPLWRDLFTKPLPQSARTATPIVFQSQRHRPKEMLRRALHRTAYLATGVLPADSKLAKSAEELLTYPFVKIGRQYRGLFNP